MIKHRNKELSPAIKQHLAKQAFMIAGHGGPMLYGHVYIRLKLNYQKRYASDKRGASPTPIDSNIDHKKPRRDNYSSASENSSETENSNYITDEQIVNSNIYSRQILEKAGDPSKANPTYEELNEANLKLGLDERFALESVLDDKGYFETADGWRYIEDNRSITPIPTPVSEESGAKSSSDESGSFSEDGNSPTSGGVNPPSGGNPSPPAPPSPSSGGGGESNYSVIEWVTLTISYFFSIFSEVLEMFLQNF